MKQQPIAIIIFVDAFFFSLLFFFLFFFFVPVTQFCLVSICLCFSLFAFFFFFLNTNIVVHYIIGKAGNELVSFFNSLYQDD